MHQFFPEHFTLCSSFSPMNGCGEHRKPYVCKVPSECVLLTRSWPFKDPEGNCEVFSLHYPSASEAQGEVAKPSSGFCVDVNSVCRICLP